MNPRLSLANMKRALAFVVLASFAVVANADTISINLYNSSNIFPESHTVDAADSAGIVPANNWNNIGFAGGVVDTTTGLISINNSSGAAAGMFESTLTTSYVGDTYTVTGITAPPSANRDFMSSYLSWDSDDGDGPVDSGNLNISGLGAAYTSAGYSVIVYSDADQNDRRYNITIDGTTHSVDDGSSFNGAFTVGNGIELNPSTGSVENYVVFSGLTAASFSIDMASSPGRGAVNAIQITTETLFPQFPILEIDRLSGTIDLKNSTNNAIEIKGYSITSAAGALNQSQWKTISDNYDQSGDDSIDANEDWFVLTNSTSKSDFSESSFAGGELSSLATVRLGDAGAWIGSPSEDLQIKLLLADGSELSTQIQFTGNSGSPIALADLNTDGNVDADDWLIFRGNLYGADLSTATAAERFQAGDADADGDVDRLDFLDFKEAYIAVNGAQAFAALTTYSVPEPSAWILAVFCIGLYVSLARKIRNQATVSAYSCSLIKSLPAQNDTPRSKTMKRAQFITALLVTISLFTSSAEATLLGHYKLDETSGTVAVDSSGNGNDGVVGGAPDLAATGISNTGVLFANTADQGITVDSLYSGNSARTLSAWFDANTLLSQSRILGSGAGAAAQFDLTLEADGLGLRYGNGNFFWSAGGSSHLLDGFHHVAITYDGTTLVADSTVKLYLDGVLQARDGGNENNSGQVLNTLDNNFWIGRDESGGNRFDGIIDDVQVYDTALSVTDINFLHSNPGIVVGGTAPVFLTLEVNTTTGQVRLTNPSGAAVDIDYYEIRSAAGDLVVGASLDGDFDTDGDVDGSDFLSWQRGAHSASDLSDWELHYGETGGGSGGWNSLQDQDLEGSGAPGDGNGWEEADNSSSTLLVESILNGSNAIVDGADIDLGNAFTPGGDEALTFEYHVSGAGAAFVVGTVNYVTSFSAVTAVPEPTTAILALLGLTGALGVSRRRRGVRGQGDTHQEEGPQSQKKSRAPGNRINRLFVCTLVTASLAWAVAGSTAQADVYNDRNYQFGDDSFEGSTSAGSVVGNAAGNVSSGRTLESGEPGDPSASRYDLDAEGSPLYIDVSTVGTGRPGSSAGDLGILFDGSDDRLAGSALNRPADTVTALPGFSVNLAGILTRGVQMWAYPDAAKIGNGAQTLVFDSQYMGGPQINAAGMWTQAINETSNAVPSTVAAVGNQWQHVMQHVYNQNDPNAPVPINYPLRNHYSVVYVNGVAASAEAVSFPGTMDLTANGASGLLLVGAEDDGSGGYDNHFQGTMDDLKMYVHGNNETGSPGDLSDGEDWGTFDLFADNDWIAQEILDTITGQVLVPGDTNKSGAVSGNGLGPDSTDDVSAFITGWLSENRLNGIGNATALAVGDWNTWDSGDFDHDGQVTLLDWELLTQNHPAAQSLSLGTLLAARSVPEPTSLVGLSLLGLLAVSKRARAETKS